VDQQATAPKGIEQNEPIQVPIGTPAQIQREFTLEPSPVDNPDPVDTFELSPDHPGPIDTYE
jgi:hypothetical protein